MILFYVSVFFITLGLTFIVRKIAIRKAILDIPNIRSSHTVSTPRGGGLAIIITWLAGLTWLFFMGFIDHRLYYSFLSGIPLVFISFLDDVFTLKPVIRFGIQLFSALAALFCLGGLKTVDFGFINIEASWLWTPVAFVAILWAINLFNFLDGIDGYIGSEIVFIGLTIFALLNDNITLLMAFATLGFLVWNWPKAKIFMGDVGSTYLGFIIALLAIYHQNTGKSSLIIWLIVTSLFWFDATVTLFRRFKNKEKLSEAHRQHAYQRIVQAGFSHKKTVLYSIIINLILGGLAALAFYFNKFSLLFLFIDIIFLTCIMRSIDKKNPFKYKELVK